MERRRSFVEFSSSFFVIVKWGGEDKWGEERWSWEKERRSGDVEDGKWRWSREERRGSRGEVERWSGKERLSGEMKKWRGEKER